MSLELLNRKIVNEVDMERMKRMRATEGEIQANRYLLRCIQKLKPDDMNVFVMQILFHQEEGLFYAILDAVEEIKAGHLPVLVSNII